MSRPTVAGALDGQDEENNDRVRLHILEVMRFDWKGSARARHWSTFRIVCSCLFLCCFCSCSFENGGQQNHDASAAERSEGLPQPKGKKTRSLSIKSDFPWIIRSWEKNVPKQAIELMWEQNSPVKILLFDGHCTTLAQQKLLVLQMGCWTLHLHFSQKQLFYVELTRLCECLGSGLIFR